MTCSDSTQHANDATMNEGGSTVQYGAIMQRLIICNRLIPTIKRQINEATELLKQAQPVLDSDLDVLGICGEERMAHSLLNRAAGLIDEVHSEVGQIKTALPDFMHDEIYEANDYTTNGLNLQIAPDVYNEKAVQDLINAGQILIDKMNDIRLNIKVYYDTVLVPIYKGR